MINNCKYFLHAVDVIANTYELSADRSVGLVMSAILYVVKFLCISIATVAAVQWQIWRTAYSAVLGALVGPIECVYSLTFSLLFFCTFDYKLKYK